MRSGLRLALWCVIALAFVPAAVPVGGQDGGDETSGGAPGEASRGVAMTVVPAFRQADNVAVITIRGPIDMTTEYSVRRRLAIAEKSGADAVVFEIDSPGGEVGAVLEICNAIKSSPIANTVAWINPDAYSGGAIVALACREIVVAPNSSFGDALPVVMTLTGAQRATEVMPAAKILPPLLAEVVDSARKNGWDEYLVQALVTDGVELWQVEHVETGERYCVDADEYRALFGKEPPRGLAELQAARGSESTLITRPGDANDDRRGGGEGDTAFRAASRALGETIADTSEGEVNELDLLARASTRPDFFEESAGSWSSLGYVSDGTSAVVLRGSQMAEFGLSSATIADDAGLETFFGAKNLRRVDRNWSEGLVSFLTNPVVRGVLIALFLIGIFVEITNPGVAVAGLMAAVALVLAMAPAMLLGLATWWELAAIGAGIVLIGMEVFVIPGFGVFGVGGLIFLFGGLVWTFVGPSSGGLFPDSPGGQARLLYGLTAVTLAIATAVVTFVFLPKKLHELPLFKRLVLSDDPGDGEELLAAMAPKDTAGLVVGDEGTADSPLMPIGRGRFKSGLHEVRAAFGSIDASTRIRVVDAGGMTPTVEAAQEGDA